MMFPKKYLLPFLAIATGLLVAGIIIALTGANPFKAFYALLQGSGLAPKASYAGHKNMLTDFLGYINFLTPMIFAALAVAVALKAGLFNIGVSGQMLAAGFCASVIVGYSPVSGVLAKPLVLLIGIIVGGLSGGLLGILKHRFRVNEVVSSIMCNYIFQYVISFFIYTFYTDPVSRQSRSVSQAARLTLMDVEAWGLKMDLPLAIFPVLAAVVLVWFLFQKTVRGYEWKAVGFSPTAAGYAGIHVGRSMISAMTVSGMLAGLAGVSYYLGFVASIQPRVLVNTGFDAVAVSLLGGNHPVGILFATMFISIIGKGSTYMKSAAGVDTEIASLITGIILLFSTCNMLVLWKRKRR